MKKTFENPEITIVSLISEAIANENDTDRVSGSWDD